MSEKFKLGLTRNRLFSLDNTVVFVGVCLCPLDEVECAKVIKMLSVKEPVITGVIELDDDSVACIVTEKHEPVVSFSDESVNDVLTRYEKDGIDFSRCLFEFTVCGGNSLVIGAHTAVCDSKSLLRLAMEFVEFYTHKSISVEPSDIVTFPDMQSLPAKLNSPVIDKLSADIESKWKKKRVHFDVSDCRRAIEKYSAEKSTVGCIEVCFSSEFYESAVQYCGENGIDVSSLVAYGFYDTLYKYVDAPKKARKLSAYSDRRLFVSGMDKCRVGAFDGYVDVSLKGRDEKKDTIERVKAFHKARYKGVTSAFRSFYDELLLMKLPAECCDASYMSVAGCYSSSAAKRLANGYGCSDSRIMSYFSCDFRQAYWSGLSFFEDVKAFEPFVHRFYSMVDTFMSDKGIVVSFRYDKLRISDDDAQKIVSEAKECVLSFLD